MHPFPNEPGPAAPAPLPLDYARPAPDVPQSPARERFAGAMAAAKFVLGGTAASAIAVASAACVHLSKTGQIPALPGCLIAFAALAATAVWGGLVMLAMIGMRRATMGERHQQRRWFFTCGSGAAFVCVIGALVLAGWLQGLVLGLLLLPSAFSFLTVRVRRPAWRTTVP